MVEGKGKMGRKVGNWRMRWWRMKGILGWTEMVVEKEVGIEWERKVDEVFGDLE